MMIKLPKKSTRPIRLLQWDEFQISGKYRLLKRFIFVNIVIINDAQSRFEWYYAIKHKKGISYEIFCDKGYVGSVYRSYNDKWLSANFHTKKFKNPIRAVMNTIEIHLGFHGDVVELMGLNRVWEEIDKQRGREHGNSNIK